MRRSHTITAIIAIIVMRISDTKGLGLFTNNHTTNNTSATATNVNKIRGTNARARLGK